MKKNWEDVFFGNLAFEGAIRISAFDLMAKVLPTTPWGLFMWEGQSSDIALMSAWRRRREATKIFAYQHAFSRPFDLRLHSDSRDFKAWGPEAMPCPDKLCVNNKESLSLVRKAGFPEDKIARVEASRYFELKGKFLIHEKQIPSVGRILLVVMGGGTDSENEFQFKLLRDAAAIGGLQSYSQVLVKTHPDISSDGLKPVFGSNFQLSITDQSLNNLWSEVDVVYGAHSTGASWEASWYGIPAISVCAINSLNLNPLASLEGACFVESGADLSKQLKNPKLVKIPEDYFFLDENLKLWEELLSECAKP
jgi:surface carbohydrate biosynthesis protein (TIGR04326 family)